MILTTVEYSGRFFKKVHFHGPQPYGLGPSVGGLCDLPAPDSSLHLPPVSQNTQSQFLLIALYRCTELSDSVPSEATAAVRVYSE